MKKFSPIRPAFFAAALFATAVVAHGQQYGPPQQQPYNSNQQQPYNNNQQQPYNNQQQPYGNHNQYDQGRDQRDQWDAPPSDFNDVGRRGFHDGIDAARFDAQNNRHMNFAQANSYRRPPVARNLRDSYRSAFARGYQAGQHRMEEMRQHNENDWHHDHENWDNHYPYNSPR